MEENNMNTPMVTIKMEVIEMMHQFEESKSHRAVLPSRIWNSTTDSQLDIINGRIFEVQHRWISQTSYQCACDAVMQSHNRLTFTRSESFQLWSANSLLQN